MIYCGRCRARLDTGAGFCGRCGSLVLAPPSTPPDAVSPPPTRVKMERSVKVALGGLGALLIIALLASAAHNNTVAPTASPVAHLKATSGPARATRGLPMRPMPIASATVDRTQGSDSAPVGRATTLPAGVMPSGCMVGTRGHSLVVVYTESTYGATSDCRSVAQGDYLYTKAPTLSTLVRYCSVSKTDGSVTLDVYDKAGDLALLKHPEVGTVANAMCAIYQSNNQWIVARDMSLVPTYVPASTSMDATPTSSADSVGSSDASLASDEGGTGPTAECNDGTTSYSQHPSGTCSHHDGVAVWDDHLQHSTP